MKINLRNKTMIMLLVILLTSSITSLNIVKADNLQITPSNTYLVAGQENEITIEIRNIGDHNVVGVQAILSSATSGINILEGSQKVFTEIESGKRKEYSPVIYVDKSLPLGSYTLSLTVTYQKITFEYVTSTVSIGIIVSETYTPKIGFSVNPVDIAATTGENNQLTYTFKNLSNHTLENLEFNIQSTSTYITIVDEDSYIISSLQPEESISITPMVSVLENTPLATYSLDTSISFIDEEDTFFETFTLPINVNAAKVSRTTVVTIEDIVINPELVQPGDIFTLQISIACSGADAYDLMGTISFPSTTPISPLSPSTINLGDLEAGESTDVSYELLVSGETPAGQYMSTATFTYTSSKGVSKSLTETVTILISGLIDFELLDTPSVTVSAGDTQEFEADLLLIGTESVEFVSIGVVEDDVVKRVSGSDEYIGAVDPDSPIPFDINYRVNPDAPEGEHELELNVKYRDHLNKEHEERIGLNINIGEPVDTNPEPQQSGLWVWIRRILGLGP